MSKNKKIIDLTKKNEISDNDILAINDISANEVKKIKISTIKNYSSTGDFVESVNGLSGDVEITTYEVAENTNLYFTEFRIVNDLISQNPSVPDTDKSLSLKALKDYVFNLVETAITTMEFWIRSYIDVNFVPPQVGNEDKFLKTDGIDASWEQIDDNDIFVTANNLNKNLKDAIEDGDLSGGVPIMDWGDITGNINDQTDIMSLVKSYNPIGAIMSFTADGVPANFLIANGQTISRTTYAELFAVIGTKYGAGNGSTTFNLPNLNNEFGRYTTNTSLVGNKHGHSTARPTTAFSTGASGAHTHAKGTIGWTGQLNARWINNTTVNRARFKSANGIFSVSSVTRNEGMDWPNWEGNYKNSFYFSTRTFTMLTNYLVGSVASATHSHTITAGGDSETAPRHIMLLACIKVK